MSNSDKNNELFIRWINNDLTQEELRQIQADPDYQKYRTIIGEVDQWKVPALNKEESYNRLVRRRAKKGEAKIRSINWYQTQVFKIAAAFLVLAAALTFFIVNSGSVVTYETGIAETEEIILPDGSVVHLAASSQLSYDEDSWEKSRELKLQGTSHFDVVHLNGAPFKVHFQQNTVEVLGTSFEIRSLKDFASVTCYAGKVSVTSPDTTVLLTRGRGVRSGRERRLEVFEFENYVWSQNATRFTKAPLSAVFESMEAQFGIEIITGKIDLTRTFTGSYTHDDVELALKMVCNPMNISYALNENTVTLQ